MALTKAKASNILLTTPAASSNDTTPATTQYVTTAINNLIDGAPATLNTLDEIAAALNDDAALNTTLTNAIAAKLPLAGGTLTGALNINANAPLILNGTDPLISLQNGGSNHWQLGFENTQSDRFVIYDNNASSYRLTIDSSGNTTFAGSVNATSDFKVNGTLLIDSAMNAQNLNLVQVAGGSSTAPTIRFTGDVNTGITRSASDTLNIITAGTTRAYFGPAEAVLYYGTNNKLNTTTGGINVTGSITASNAIQASSNSGSNAAFQLGWQNSSIALQMKYDSNYYMNIETHAQTRDLILNNKAADGAGDIRFNTGVTLTERLAIKADGKIELASASYVEKPFRILYNGTSTATQYMKIYDKAASIPPKNLHFLMYGQNHSEYSVEVKMHIPTYAGFYSGYGTADQGMGPTVEIDCGGLPNQTNIFQEIIAYSPVTDSSNYTEIWLKITPPHSTTNIYVREYADSDLLIQTPSWTTTAPGITRSFPILKGHRSINTTHIGRDGDVEIRDGSLRQSGAPGFKVYNTAGISKNSGWQNISPLILTVEYNNNTSGWSSSNGRFTPTKAGYYLFTFGGWSSSANNGNRYATSFAKNGSLKFISGSQYNLVDSPLNGHSEVVYMNGSTDYVDLYAYSAVAVTWGGGSHSIWWGAEWIH